MTRSSSIRGVFVYGTLKRGQCRERCWPLAPLSVESCWTRASLYSRSDYPALAVGDDRVAGELWCYDQGDLPAVLRVLDEIEQTDQPGLDNLYDRELVEVVADNGVTLGLAHTYFYATDPMSDRFTLVRPGADGFARWLG